MDIVQYSMDFKLLVLASCERLLRFVRLMLLNTTFSYTWIFVAKLLKSMYFFKVCSFT